MCTCGPEKSLSKRQHEVFNLDPGTNEFSTLHFKAVSLLVAVCQGEEFINSPVFIQTSDC